MTDEYFSPRGLLPSRSRQPTYAPEPRSVTLNYANPLLTIDRGWIRLTLGADATGNIVLSAGTFPSQHVVIECVAHAGTAVLPVSTASRTSLPSSWTPVARHTLLLGWSAPLALWLQLGRNANV